MMGIASCTNQEPMINEYLLLGTYYMRRLSFLFRTFPIQTPFYRQSSLLWQLEVVHLLALRIGEVRSSLRLANVTVHSYDLYQLTINYLRAHVFYHLGYGPIGGEGGSTPSSSHRPFELTSLSQTELPKMEGGLCCSKQLLIL